MTSSAGDFDVPSGRRRRHRARHCPAPMCVRKGRARTAAGPRHFAIAGRSRHSTRVRILRQVLKRGGAVLAGLHENEPQCCSGIRVRSVHQERADLGYADPAAGIGMLTHRACMGFRMSSADSRLYGFIYVLIQIASDRRTSADCWAFLRRSEGNPPFWRGSSRHKLIARLGRMRQLSSGVRPSG